MGEFGVELLALLHGELTALDEVVHELLTLLGSSCNGAHARKEHLAQAFAEVRHGGVGLVLGFVLGFVSHSALLGVC